MFYNFIFEAMFTIVPILVVAGFIFTFAMIFSPKLRAKMNRLDIKAAKYTVEENKDDIADIISTTANTAIGAKNRVIDESGDSIKRAARFETEIQKERVETIAKAVKDGLSNEETIFCKYCGAVIDADSVFCKKCGKEH